MKVLFDGYWWIDGPPSGRNVLRSLVGAWVADHPEDEVTISVPHASVGAVRQELTGSPVSVLGVPRFARQHLPAAVWGVGSATTFDFALSQNFSAVVHRAKVHATFVHDGIYRRHPEWFTRAERLYLAAIRPTLSRSSLVLTSSDSEAEYLRSAWPRLATRVHGVGLGVPQGLQNAAAEPVPALAGRRFVLAVGRLNVRKNLGRLIEAFVAAEIPDTVLAIAGAQDGRYEATGAGADSVTFLGAVSDGQLRWLYENCGLFVFPSLDEGFGLPMVEAAALGAPILASDIPPFRELGLADEHVDPRSVAAIRDGLNRWATHGPARRSAAVVPDSWTDVVGRIRALAISELGTRS